MRLKKLICVGLSLAMLASAVGCGNTATGAASAADEQEAIEEIAQTDSAEETEDASAEKAAGAEASATGAAGVEEIPAEDISVTWEDSHVYADLTLGRYETITTYGVKGYEEVPFISASAYLDLIYGGSQRTAVENGVMKIAVNDTEAVIDPFADTIVIENPSRLRSAGAIDGAIVDESEFNVVTVSAKNESNQTDAVPLTVSLKDYNMPVIAYEDDILMPFLALQNTFGSITMRNLLAYNGRDYFNAFEAENYMMEHSEEPVMDTPYMKALYKGPFSQKTETSQAYADYGYYSICLLLDLTFGHKEEKNITTFDEYFTRMNAKSTMCSTNPSSAMTAEFLLFNYLFDSGHDALFGYENVFGVETQADPSEVEGIVDDIKESEEGKELFEDEPDMPETDDALDIDVILGALLEKGFKIPEVAPLYAWTFYFQSIRPDDYGDVQLDYAGDTAVIYFNAFLDDATVRRPSYYLDPVKEEDEETSSFAFFYRCFEDIQKHDEVKNVVINLSDNGGGNATGLVSVLGFLSEDGEVKITDRDVVSGSYREEYYHVDTNLDGIADDQDGFGEQYDFYIMCSGNSYSCANAMPYFAQQSGLATIIGTNPGGGDCIVASFVDAYGRCACYSGMLKLGKDDGSGFVSDEKATVVDFNMMPSVFDVQYVPWYDPAGIADAVHQYQGGAKEMVYNDLTEDQKLTEFLMKLFERITAGSEAYEEAGAAETAATAETAEAVK